MWNDFWKYNVKQLQLWYKTNTDLTCFNKNWKKAKSPKHVFHLVVLAFKAWHRMDYKIKHKPPHVLAALHLCDNIHLHDDNGMIIIPSRGAKRLLNSNNILHREFNVGQLYNRRTTPWMLLTPDELHQKFSVGHEISQAYWVHNVILNAIPQYVKDTIQFSDYRFKGWAALPTSHDTLDRIYYLDDGNFSATVDVHDVITSLVRFQPTEDFITKLRPILILYLAFSGKFRVLG